MSTPQQIADKIRAKVLFIAKNGTDKTISAKATLFYALEARHEVKRCWAKKVERKGTDGIEREFFDLTPENS